MALVSLFLRSKRSWPQARPTTLLAQVGLKLTFGRTVRRSLGFRFPIPVAKGRLVAVLISS